MTNHHNQTEINDPTAGQRENTAMDRKTPRRSPGRRLLAAGAAMGAVALFASAAAWACTLRDNTTFQVWKKDSFPSCELALALCSRAIGSAQVGLAVVDTSGDVLAFTGTGFTDATGDTAYSITWRHPGSEGNCHRTNPDGSIVSMGASVTVSTAGVLAETTRTAKSTVGRNPETGKVRICIQDYEFGGTSTASATPTVVVGSVVDIEVLL